MNNLNLKNFEKTINYNFKNKQLLMLALSHSSFSNENKKIKHENNERLEFLGDAVLELVISDYIYNSFKDMPEGELTKLRAGIVCEPTLAKKAKLLKIGDVIFLGKGEETTGGRNRDSILADAFEAIIGAVYLDGGIVIAKKYILDLMIDEIAVLKQSFKTIDCKTHLQEIIQKTSKSPIIYNIIDEAGPDHDKVFFAEVSHEGTVLGKGSGRSKKEAEQSAANDALNKYK